MRSKTLFLDDDEARHKAFADGFTRGGFADRFELVQCRTAAEAIAALDAGGVVDAFLDHDLCEEDVMSVPGEPTKVPTGMAVVDHILQMESPPAQVVVHTMNPPAADEMCRRLAASGKILVHRISFHLIPRYLGGWK